MNDLKAAHLRISELSNVVSNLTVKLNQIKYLIKKAEKTAKPKGYVGDLNIFVWTANENWEEILKIIGE